MVRRGRERPRRPLAPGRRRGHDGRVKWIVGLDLRPRSAGAVRFAGWLAASSRAPGGEEVVGVHVLEEDHLRVVLRFHHLDEVTASAQEAARRTLSDAGVAARVVRVTRGRCADEGLEDARRELRADAVVVGRMARREGHSLVRLGRVARELLRTLASPVVVVPPDLEATQIGDGPVVALSDLAADSSDACRFASRVAERLGRGLLVAHVVPRPEEYAEAHFPAASVERMAREHQAEAEMALAGWVAARGLSAARTAVLRGPVIDRSLELAAGERAPLLVMGSHRRSVIERLRHASVASELAAAAPIAVAVVPPPE